MLHYDFYQTSVFSKLSLVDHLLQWMTKRVKITIGNGSRVEVIICGQLVSECASWITHSDTLATQFLIQQQRMTNSGSGIHVDNTEYYE